MNSTHQTLGNDVRKKIHHRKPEVVPRSRGYAAGPYSGRRSAKSLGAHVAALSLFPYPGVTGSLGHVADRNLEPKWLRNGSFFGMGAERLALCACLKV